MFAGELFLRVVGVCAAVSGCRARVPGIPGCKLEDTALRIYMNSCGTKLSAIRKVSCFTTLDLPHIYIDTVYYSSALLAKIGPFLGVDWEDEAVKQIVLHLDRLQDGDKPFFIHCEENHGGKRSEGSWARGNGWVMMTLAEILPLLDKKSARYKNLLVIFQQLASEIAKLQTKNGLWRTILDDKVVTKKYLPLRCFYLRICVRKKRTYGTNRIKGLITKSVSGLVTSVDLGPRNWRFRRNVAGDDRLLQISLDRRMVVGHRLVFVGNGRVGL